VLGAVRAALRAGDGPVLVAFSGGLDSSVLLHAASVACRETGVALHAIHVDHGLQRAARDWPAHCRRVADSCGVRLHVAVLPVAQPAGIGLEAWARRERYAVIADRARALGAERVLAAHHADDQAETVLLRLARGAGLRGLAAMAAERSLDASFDQARLLRPLLALPRAVLMAYARSHALEWVDDPSNADLRHARNRVRRVVLPALEQAAPAARANLVRAAALAAEAQVVLDEVAAGDLTAALAGARADRSRAPVVLAAVLDEAIAGSVLVRTPLIALGPARQRLALRAWLEAAGRPMPSLARLDEARRQMLEAAAPQGRVVLDGVALCRFRDWLWLEPDRPRPVLPEADEILRWGGESRLEAAGGWVVVTPAEPGDPAAVDDGRLRALPIRVSGLSSATRLRLDPGGVSRSLKHWHQQFGVPARLRAGLPGISVGDELRWAAGLGAVREADRRALPAKHEGAGVAWRLRWEPASPDDPRWAICALQHPRLPRV